MQQFNTFYPIKYLIVGCIDNIVKLMYSLNDRDIDRKMLKSRGRKYYGEIDE